MNPEKNMNYDPIFKQIESYKGLKNYIQENHTFVFYGGGRLEFSIEKKGKTINCLQYPRRSNNR